MNRTYGLWGKMLALQCCHVSSAQIMSLGLHVLYVSVYISYIIDTWLYSLSHSALLSHPITCSLPPPTPSPLQAQLSSLIKVLLWLALGISSTCSVFSVWWDQEEGRREERKGAMCLLALFCFFPNAWPVSVQTQPAVWKTEPGFHLEVTHKDPSHLSTVVLYQGLVRYLWEPALLMTERTSRQNLLRM